MTQVPASSFSLYGLWGADADDIYAVGQGGRILHYDGADWNSLTSPTSETLLGVWGPSADDIFVVGENGTILRKHSVSGLINEMPAVPRILSVWPNPFNPTTTISFSVAQEQWVTIAVFDVEGRKLETVAEQTFGPGSHSVLWTGRDDRGRAVPSGTYLVQLETGGSSVARKITLVR